MLLGLDSDRLAALSIEETKAERPDVGAVLASAAMPQRIGPPQINRNWREGASVALFRALDSELGLQRFEIPDDIADREDIADTALSVYAAQEIVRTAHYAGRRSTSRTRRGPLGDAPINPQSDDRRLTAAVAEFNRRSGAFIGVRLLGIDGDLDDWDVHASSSDGRLLAIARFEPRSDWRPPQLSGETPPPAAAVIADVCIFDLEDGAFAGFARVDLGATATGGRDGSDFELAVGAPIPDGGRLAFTGFDGSDFFGRPQSVAIARWRRGEGIERCLVLPRADADERDEAAAPAAGAPELLRQPPATAFKINLGEALSFADDSLFKASPALTAVIAIRPRPSDAAAVPENPPAEGFKLADGELVVHRERADGGFDEIELAEFRAEQITAAAVTDAGELAVVGNGESVEVFCLDGARDASKFAPLCGAAPQATRAWRVGGPESPAAGPKSRFVFGLDEAEGRIAVGGRSATGSQVTSIFEVAGARLELRSVVHHLQSSSPVAYQFAPRSQTRPDRMLAALRGGDLEVWTLDRRVLSYRGGRLRRASSMAGPSDVPQSFGWDKAGAAVSFISFKREAFVIDDAAFTPVLSEPLTVREMGDDGPGQDLSAEDFPTRGAIYDVAADGRRLVVSAVRVGKVFKIPEVLAERDYSRIIEFSASPPVVYDVDTGEIAGKLAFPASAPSRETAYGLGVLQGRSSKYLVATAFDADGLLREGSIADGRLHVWIFDETASGGIRPDPVASIEKFSEFGSVQTSADGAFAAFWGGGTTSKDVVILKTADVDAGGDLAAKLLRVAAPCGVSRVADVFLSSPQQKAWQFWRRAGKPQAIILCASGAATAYAIDGAVPDQGRAILDEVKDVGHPGQTLGGFTIERPAVGAFDAGADRLAVARDGRIRFARTDAAAAKGAASCRTAPLAIRGEMAPGANDAPGPAGAAGKRFDVAVDRLFTASRGGVYATATLDALPEESRGGNAIFHLPEEKIEEALRDQCEAIAGAQSARPKGTPKQTIVFSAVPGSTDRARGRVATLFDDFPTCGGKPGPVYAASFSGDLLWSPETGLAYRSTSFSSLGPGRIHTGASDAVAVFGPAQAGKPYRIAIPLSSNEIYFDSAPIPACTFNSETLSAIPEANRKLAPAEAKAFGVNAYSNYVAWGWSKLAAAASIAGHSFSAAKKSACRMEMTSGAMPEWACAVKPDADDQEAAATSEAEAAPADPELESDPGTQ